MLNEIDEAVLAEVVGIAIGVNSFAIFFANILVSIFNNLADIIISIIKHKKQGSASPAPAVPTAREDS